MNVMIPLYRPFSLLIDCLNTLLILAATGKFAHTLTPSFDVDLLVCYEDA
jgi:hypothetical protein